MLLSFLNVDPFFSWLLFYVLNCLGTSHHYFFVWDLRGKYEYCSRLPPASSKYIYDYKERRRNLWNLHLWVLEAEKTTSSDKICTTSWMSFQYETFNCIHRVVATWYIEQCSSITCITCILMDDFFGGVFGFLIGWRLGCGVKRWKSNEVGAGVGVVASSYVC